MVVQAVKGDGFRPPRVQDSSPLQKNRVHLSKTSLYPCIMGILRKLVTATADLQDGGALLEGFPSTVGQIGSEKRPVDHARNALMETARCSFHRRVQTPGRDPLLNVRDPGTRRQRDRPVEPPRVLETMGVVAPPAVYTSGRRHHPRWASNGSQ